MNTWTDKLDTRIPGIILKCCPKSCTLYKTRDKAHNLQHIGTLYTVTIHHIDYNE